MANYKQVGYGSQGSDVKTLQELLNKNGANLTVDGIFGNQTKKAVQDYQKANGLAVDGIVGTNTWGALTQVTTPTVTDPTPTAPSTQDTVPSVQDTTPTTQVTTPTTEVTAPTTQVTTPTTEPWTYDSFTPSESTTGADQKRQEVSSQKPGDFSYGAYEKSDIVKQAEAMLQQQLGNKPGAYQSAWQTQLDDTLNKILNREKFTYDLNGDALYQQYKDQYVTQGQMAMMDTMGQAAAMTGGYGNSYAQTAGQQTYQGYLQQLNDRIPELYQLALDQYNREGQELYNQYGLFADRDQQDYGRYRDSVSDYYTNLDYLTNEARYQSEQDYGKFMDAYNMAYGQHRDQVSDWQNEQARADEDYWNQYNRDYGQYTDDRNLSYQQNRDQVSDNQWDQSFQYQQDRDNKSDEQWDQSFQYQQDRDQKSDEQWQAEFDEAKRQFDQQYELNAGKSNSSSSNNSTGNGGKTGYDNGSRKESEIIAMQNELGVTADGKWGPKTQDAAQKKWGTTSADAAWEAMGGNGGGGDETPSVDTDNTKLFRSSIMTSTEFARHGNKATVKGKTYTSYKSYIEACLADWTDNDVPKLGRNLTDDEVNFLMDYYGL